MSQLAFLALLVGGLVVAALAVGAYIYGNVYAAAGRRTRRWMRLGLPSRRTTAQRLAAFRAALRQRGARRAEAERLRLEALPDEVITENGVTYTRRPGQVWTVAHRETEQASQRARWEARERAANSGRDLIAVTHAPAWAAELGVSAFAQEGDETTRTLQAAVEHFADSEARPEPHVGANADWSPHDWFDDAGQSDEAWWSERLQQYDAALKIIDSLPRLDSGQGAFAALGQTTEEALHSFVSASQHLHAYRMLRIGQTGELPLVREKVAA
jgi:hypothetical protein